MGFYGGDLKKITKGQLSQSDAERRSRMAKSKGGEPKGGVPDPDKAKKCAEGCAAKGLSPGTPEWTTCITGCAGGGVIVGKDGKDGKGGGCGKGKVTSGGYPNGRDWEGCPCSAAYFPNEGEACQAGYTATGSGADYRCECDKYDAEVGDESGKEKLGEFNWPTEMSDYYGQLMGRGRELLNKKPGYGEAIMKMMMGQGIDLARSGEVNKRQAMQADLGAEGLLGTGAGINALRVLPSETEAGISNLSREIQFQNEAQKRKDTELWTTLADKLFGTGMGYHQTREAINAGRRGEGLTAQALWLEYLKSLLSSWKG